MRFNAKTSLVSNNCIMSVFLYDSSKKLNFKTRICIKKLIINSLDILKCAGPKPTIALICHEEYAVRGFFSNSAGLLTFSSEELDLVLSNFGNTFFKKFEEMEEQFEKEMMENSRWVEPYEKFLTNQFSSYNEFVRG